MVTTGKWEPIKTVTLNKPVMLTDGDIIVIGECQALINPENFDYIEGVGFSGYEEEWDWDFNIEDLTHWMALPLFPEKLFIR